MGSGFPSLKRAMKGSDGSWFLRERQARGPEIAGLDLGSGAWSCRPSGEHVAPVPSQHFTMLPHFQLMLTPRQLILEMSLCAVISTDGREM